MADDAADVRALLRAHLTVHGYEVSEAADGREALELLRTITPDVVLADLEMPVMNGYELLAAIKDDETLEHLPVVFVTAREDTTHLVAALGRGAHDYLRKPFEPPELLARVQAAVRVKQLQDQLRRVNAQLERQACTDQLTTLYNRRFLDTHLERHLSRASRHGRTLSVLLLDVDRFKQINDTHGHHAGDRVLITVAARLARRVRREDLVGRWGGEEFMVIAPETDAPGAGPLAESLRSAIAEAPFNVEGQTMQVTASVGWAAWRGDSPESLMRRADAALYAAKAAGRNIVRGD